MSPNKAAAVSVIGPLMMICWRPQCTCSFADGVSVEDVDWDSQDGRYRVRVQGQWIVVPDAALVTEPNRFGPAVVWPFLDGNGVMQIRCFLPGAGS
jgi:hypothetical protein